MVASDALRTLAASSALAGTCALGACFFDLADVVTAAPDASAPAGGAGDGGDGGAGGGVGGGGAAASSASAGTGGAPAAWWDMAWTRRVRLDIDNSRGGELSDFPLLVTLDATRIDYASVLDDGADLRFVASDGLALLPHEIDRWDEAGTSHVWIEIPEIPVASDPWFVWMYFGNAAAADAQDAQAVWTDRYAAVYHLGDDPTGPAMADSSQSGHDAVPVNLVLADRVTGQIGEAIHFAGAAVNAPRVRLVDDLGAFDAAPGGATSFEAWVQRESSTAWMFVMMNEGCCEGTAVYFDDNANVGATFSPETACCTPTVYEYVGAPFDDADHDWHYLAVVWDRSANTMTLYVDGVAAGTTPLTKPGPSIADATMHIGADWDGAQGMIGIIDEARFADGALSPEYVEVQHRSMTDQLITYGRVETVPR